MLVFIDESGDPGMKFGEGSSDFFTVVLVAVDDAKEYRTLVPHREIQVPFRPK